MRRLRWVGLLHRWQTCPECHLCGHRSAMPTDRSSASATAVMQHVMYGMPHCRGGQCDTVCSRSVGCVQREAVNCAHHNHAIQHDAWQQAIHAKTVNVCGRFDGHCYSRNIERHSVVVITSLEQQKCSQKALTRPHQHCPPLHVHIPRLSPSLLRLPQHKGAVEYPLLISSAYVRFGASSYRPSRYTYSASNGAAGSEVCPCLHLVNSLFLHTQSALAGR